MKKLRSLFKWVWGNLTFLAFIVAILAYTMIRFFGSSLNEQLRNLLVNSVYALLALALVKFVVDTIRRTKK